MTRSERLLLAAFLLCCLYAHRMAFANCNPPGGPGETLSCCDADEGGCDDCSGRRANCCPPLVVGPPPAPPAPPGGGDGGGDGGGGDESGVVAGAGGCGASGCSNAATIVDGNPSGRMLESVHFSIACGRSVHESSQYSGQLRIWSEDASTVLATPQGLVYANRLALRLQEIKTEDLPEGVAREVTLWLKNSCEDPIVFQFADGADTALPTGEMSGTRSRLRMVDAAGSLVASNPVYYEWYVLGSNGFTRFSADTREAVFRSDHHGRRISLADVGIEVIRDSEDVLRQVKTADSLANIVVINDFKYEIRFYPTSGVGAKDGNGYYTVSGDPFSTYTVENPAASTIDFGELRVTREVNGQQYVYDYQYTEASDQWQLTTGGGQRVETVRHMWNDDNTEKLTIREIRDGDGDLVHKKTEKRRVYPVGERLVEEVVDPDGLQLTTTTLLYEDPLEIGKYQQRRAVVKPDGSWEMYDYATNRRTILVVKPFKDLAWNDVENLSVEEAAALGDATYYDYTAVDPEDTPLPQTYRSRTITRKIQGIVVSKTYHAYKTADDHEVKITERCLTAGAAYGDAANLRSVTTYYNSTAGEAAMGRIKTSESPDGRLSTYTYEYGTYTADPDPALCSFAPGAGSAFRQTVVYGTTVSPEGIAFKTTKSVAVTDAQGNEVLHETYVYTGAGYERIDWTVVVYDERGRATDTYKSNGTHSESTWGCCGMDSMTTETGMEYTFTHDVFHRLTAQTRVGYNGTADITTSFTYDAADRLLAKTRAAGELSLGGSWTYDLAGRPLTATNAAGLTATYDYADGGRAVTVTEPGGATRVTTNYLDGSTKSTTGTAIVAQYRDWGVNADGTQWETVFTGSNTSALWQKTTTGFLGHTVKTEKPDFAGGIVVSEHLHNSFGLLIKVSQPGQAPTLYEYDSLGNLTRVGLDTNRNDALDLASADRINGTDTLYEKDSLDQWWRKTTTSTYAIANDATPTTTGTRKQRLTGFSSDVAAETQSTDIHGNTTATTTGIDRANKTVTRTTDTPDATNSTVLVTINGLPTSSTSKSSIATTYQYDVLGRRTGVTDPRIGQTVTHYNTLGQVDYIQDPAGNQTSYTYSSTTGRRTVVENALAKKTYTAYNDRGRVTRTWGDLPYPLEYGYDPIYGRVTQLKAFRSGNGWEGPNWPAEPGAADTTTWTYQEATGLLTAKTYADGKGTTYTYDSAGRLATRTWARLDNGTALVTTHSYDPDTGDHTTIDYSDATPDITYTHNRLGRAETVTDALGTHVFDYGDDLLLDTETISGPLYNRVLARSYDALGRDAGFMLGTTADPDADMDIDYAYEPETGRFASVTSATDTFTYEYAADSDFIETTTYPNNISVARAYETQRNLVDCIENKHNTSTVSKYDYTNDAIGRRTARTHSGTAFTSADVVTFGYNDRNEVTSADAATDANYLYSFDFDHIGNRKTYTEAANPATVYTSNNLNQYTATTNPTQAFLYDDDGNMTSEAGWTYTWNAENRLVRAEDVVVAPGTSTALEFVYDYMGRRVRKQVYTSTDAGANWTLQTDHLFVYDGWNLVLVLDEMDSDATLKTYTWGLDLSQSIAGAGGVGGLLSVNDSTGTYYATYDANGNVSEYLDSSGVVQAHLEYSPFGRIYASTGPKEDDFAFRFSTRAVDVENGLVQYTFRCYSPELGRWLTRDHIGERGGNNLAAFLANAPTNLVDISGLEPYRNPLPVYPIAPIRPPPSLRDPPRRNPPIAPPQRLLPPNPGVIELPILLSFDWITAAIRAEAAPCTSMHRENATTSARSQAIERCGSATVSDRYKCYVFMYNTIAFMIGGTNAHCTTIAKCKASCCPRPPTASCKTTTHCSYYDIFDFNLGIGTTPPLIAFVGEWVE